MSLLDEIATVVNYVNIVEVETEFANTTNFKGTTNTFTSYPVINVIDNENPTQPYQVTSKKYVDDNFQQKSSFLDPTSSVQTQLNSKLSSVTAESTYQPILSNASYLDATSSVQDQLNSKLSTSTASSTYQPILSNASYLDATSSVQDQLNSKLSTSTASSTYQPILSNASFLDATSSVQTQLNGKTTESYVNTQINNLINSAPGTLDTLGEIATILSSNVNDISTLTTSIAGKVSKTSNETVSGILTFSQAPIMSGASISSGTISDSSLASTFLKTSDASSTYLTQSNASSTYQTQSATTNALNLKADLLNPTFTGVPACPTALTSDNSTQIASTAYVKSNLSSYQTTLSGSSDITVGTIGCTSLTPTAIITSTRFTENMTTVNHSSNIYTLNFATGNVWFSGNSTTGNFTVNLTNIPTSSDTRQFTFNLITNGPTHICAFASATNTSSGTIVSSTAPRYVGGSVPTITTNVICIHTFTLIQCFATDYIIYSTSVFN